MPARILHCILTPVVFLLPLLLLVSCNEPETDATIKMKREGSVFTIPAKVNGLALEFILDTGASDVFISRTEAMFMLKHGYLGRDDFIGIERYSLADGSLEEGDSVIFREMEIGGLKLFNVRAGISNRPGAPLLLGQSALRRLGKIEINYTNNTLTIKSSTAPVEKIGSSRPLTPVDFTDPQYGIEMIYVEGGTFIMGCTPEQGNDCRSNERPERQVALSDFYIGKYTVTQEQWQAVMGANNSPFEFKGDDQPVENVSWDDVRFFIARLNYHTGKAYRLPTEAEWEYAARGGGQSQGYKYSGSDHAGEVAWHYENSENRPRPVGTKKANELGVHDMSGNVHEWISDWYGDYGSVPQTDPAGAAPGSLRVIRGGSWDSGVINTRVSYRNGISHDARYFVLGFRLAHGSD